MALRSKLADVGTTIFTVMSQLAHEHDAINLSQGFPNFDCDPALKQLVIKHLEAGRNQYAPMPGVPALRQMLANKARDLYDADIDPDGEVTITAGATQAIYTAIVTMVHPGDEVIIFDPAYDCYAPSVVSCGGIPVPIALRAPDFAIDWHMAEERISEKTRFIIVNTPHNPLGKIMTMADMHELERIVQQHGLYVLSDEVYEHIIFDDLEHASVLRFPGLRTRAFVTYSFGKLCHTTGWKVGYCIAPTPLTQEFRKIHQFNVFSVNTPMQYALAEYLQDPETYLQLPGFFQAKRDFFVQAMSESAFSMLPCEGSYFILADYSRISDLDDMSFARWLTTEHGVATIPLSPFYAERISQPVVRFCFAKTEDTLEEAANRLRNLGG
ncbi:MAG: methionine aminotransferase [Saprospiraceae bacterium]|nr:methionine aminotransferase [Saprospiraceae bacterium]